MSSDYEQFVQAITERVLAALQGGVEFSAEAADPDGSTQAGSAGGNGSRPGSGDPRASASGSGASSGSRSGTAHSQAAIRPPIGVCTGDYSQFPELRGRTGASAEPSGQNDPSRKYGEQDKRNGNEQTGSTQHGTAPVGARRDTAASPTFSEGQSDGASSSGNRDGTDDREALAGIVTASRLDDAAAQASDRVIRLSPDARLSPLAADRVKERGLHVQRAGVAVGSADRAPTRSADTWLWWAEGECPAVRAVTDAMSSALRSLPERREARGLTDAIAEMARQVRHRRAAGGVLFVPSAARAGCFANRCEPLRAVVGTCEQAVAEGITELGANVLIVEYAHHGREAMRRMVERFVCTPRKGAESVDRELRELSRCVSPG